MKFHDHNKPSIVQSFVSRFCNNYSCHLKQQGMPDSQSAEGITTDPPKMPRGGLIFFEFLSANGIFSGQFFFSFMPQISHYINLSQCTSRWQWKRQSGIIAVLSGISAGCGTEG